MHRPILKGMGDQKCGFNMPYSDMYRTKWKQCIIIQKCDSEFKRETSAGYSNLRITKAFKTMRVKKTIKGRMQLETKTKNSPRALTC